MRLVDLVEVHPAAALAEGLLRPPFDYYIVRRDAVLSAVLDRPTIVVRCGFGLLPSWLAAAVARADCTKRGV